MSFRLDPTLIEREGDRDDTSFRERMSLEQYTMQSEQRERHLVKPLDVTELYPPPSYEVMQPLSRDVFRVKRMRREWLLIDTTHKNSSRVTLHGGTEHVRQLTLVSGCARLYTVYEHDPPLMLHESFLQVAGLRAAYAVRVEAGCYENVAELASALQRALLSSGAVSTYSVRSTRHGITIRSDRTGGDNLFVLVIPTEWNERLGYPQLNSEQEVASTRVCELIPSTLRIEVDTMGTTKASTEDVSLVTDPHGSTSTQKNTVVAVVDVRAPTSSDRSRYWLSFGVAPSSSRYPTLTFAPETRWANVTTRVFSGQTEVKLEYVLLFQVDLDT